MMLRERMRKALGVAAVVLGALCLCPPAYGVQKAPVFPKPGADYDVKVELENVSGEKNSRSPYEPRLSSICPSRAMSSGTL